MKKASKETRAKVEALLKRSRKSLKDARRIHKKLQALSRYVKGTSKSKKKKAKQVEEVAASH